MAKAPTKSTTYGKSRGGKVTPKKQPSPTPDDDDETKEEGSIVGKLFDELDDDSPPKSKSRSTRAKAPPIKPKSAMKPTKKVNPPSLPSITKVAPKSKLSNEIKPSPPSKSTSKGNDSESDYDSEEEKEKLKVKNLPKPLTKNKKEDSSKLPCSNGSSTKSSLQSKTSSTTRAKKELAKKEDMPAPQPPSDDLDDEFGPDFDAEMVDALDKDLEAKGLSSSPTLPTKAKKASSAIPVLDTETKVDDIDDEDKAAEADSPLSDAGVEDEEPKEEDQAMSNHDSDDESDSNSQSPVPEEPTSIPRAQKLQALKRQAEYDSNEISDSEGGTAGLILADLSPLSPSKKARISAPSTKSSEEVVASIHKAVRTLSSRRPPSIPPTVIKSVRGKKAVGPPLPAIDYEAMIAPYGKEVVQRLMLKQFDSIKKCDWFELSVELAEEGVTRAGDKKKGKKGKETIISANELHELFHNVRLPIFVYVVADYRP
jgi:hypothetical protein